MKKTEWPRNTVVKVKLPQPVYVCAFSYFLNWMVSNTKTPENAVVNFEM